MTRFRSSTRTRRPQARRGTLLRRILRAVALGLALLLTLALLLVLLLRTVNPPYSMYMFSEAAGPIAPSLRRHWQPVRALPAHVPLAVIAAEDQRFPEHGGFDWQSIQEAVNEYRQGRRLRGASTITQQTAKNLFLWHGRSLARKLLEAGFTLAIEALWPKARILEVYLNLAEWGPGVFGIDSAARYHFGITARELSPEQAALLAAVLPNPKAYSPSRPSETVRSRARWIERQMSQLGPGWLAPLGLDRDG
ncbi:monofunctional biosynthetic peptidoglycan transglycosylase [Thioalkalivibrio sp.]|uniref:monofunctional biosynthetic peptidoglycan transglycosylase n=1 Tax=Thioalkalivibrio sp. TaxID=2093813 RepID=UPI003976965A